MTQPADPSKIQMKVGLEIHQQLASETKLFCACPVVKPDDLPLSFERKLRPAQSETGRLDPATVFEFTKAKTIVYRWNEASSCLVEADEEPPHPLNDEALDIVLTISNLLHSSIVDEIHFMRKIVIDGSNTTGFQRTAVVALGGYLQVGNRKVGVQTVTLEEDAARILGEDEKARYFALDRLGIPLVEIALQPLSETPETVGEVALQLGRALRSTGRVARGLGSIRQDINISVRGGKVVEVKGVQKLNLIPKVVAYEMDRQLGLIRLSKELGGKVASKGDSSVKDVSELMRGTSCRVIQRALAENGSVNCICKPGFAGMLGWEPLPGIRLGKELAEVARAAGLGGVIHSDEFQRQGIAREEEETLRRLFAVGKEAGLVLIAGEAAKVQVASRMIERRLVDAIHGVPAETRAPTDEGETRYMRPRPGAQRMYPETDIPDIVIDEKRVKAAAKAVSESWESRVKRYEKLYSLSGDMALKVYDSDRAQLFERLAGQLKLEGSFVASALVDLPTRLAREGVPEGAISDSVLEEVLKGIAEGRVAKEAAPDVARLLARGQAKDIESAATSLGLRPINEQELEALIDRVLREEEKLVAERGESAFSALMGEVMAKARGKADGELASRILRERLRSQRRNSASSS